MSSKPVIIENYNDDWPLKFLELQEILSQHLGDLALSIEHVGSTSVPGLAAKPIIDLDIVIDSMELLSQVIEKLNNLGYIHEGDLGIENRETFARTDDNVPYTKDVNQKAEHNLYVCNKESDALLKHITFRDILRKQPQLIEAYATLKQELAERYKHNREDYTKGKTEFVIAVNNEYKHIL
ncbi:dephospho-CoA kinase/protein folding accessory domain-containing protein [compost metagenome]